MELKCREFYLWKDDPIIHQILEIHNDYVCYWDYDPLNRWSLGSHTCSAYYFEKNIESVLPEDHPVRAQRQEFAKMQIEEAVRAQVDLEKKMLKDFRPQLLIDELESRGYTVTKK